MHPYCSPPPFLHGGPRPRSVAERFWSKVDRSDAHGCWPWTGTRHRFGYGFLSIGSITDHSKHMALAHRISWVLHTGADVPLGMCVCHVCDNPPCVRFDHLWLGTDADNKADMARKGRAGPGANAARGARNGKHTRPESIARGERNGYARLTEADVIEIRRLYAGGMTQIAIAPLFGVDNTTISVVVRRKVWKHVP